MIKHILLIYSLTLFATSFGQSLNMQQLGNWNDTGIGVNNFNQTYNDCWGWEQNGREYAVIGSVFGSHIIDVTDPSNPVEVDKIAARQQGSSIIHRDFKEYNGYLYMVGDQGDASLQIADLSFLPDSVHLIYDQDTIVKRSHNIFIDTNNNRLYSCGGTKLAGGNDLMVLDISNPTTPTLLTDLKIDIPWWDATIGYVHDIYVKNNIMYTHDLDAMHIIDLTDVASPIVLGSLTSYADQGINHSGWLHNNDTTYVMLDETHGKRLKIMDVSDPNNMFVTDLIAARPDTNIIPHNAFIHGDLVYVSYYYDGLYVYDVSDRYDVKLVGFYDTYQGPNGQGFHGCWGTYPYLPSGNIIASDLETGLYMIGFEKPAINFVKTTDTLSEGGFAKNIEISIAHGTSVPVSVDLELDAGSLIANIDDFNVTGGLPQTITFPANTTKNQSVTVNIVDDAFVEGEEVGSLNLLTPLNGVLGVNDIYTLTIFDNEFASLNELSNSSLKVYPNPIINGAVLYFTEQISFSLFNTIGEQILSRNNVTAINTAEIDKGAYFLRTQKGETIKIVIQ